MWKRRQHKWVECKTEREGDLRYLNCTGLLRDRVLDHNSCALTRCRSRQLKKTNKNSPCHHPVIAASRPDRQRSPLAARWLHWLEKRSQPRAGHVRPGAHRPDGVPAEKWTEVHLLPAGQQGDWRWPGLSFISSVLVLAKLSSVFWCHPSPNYCHDRLHHRSMEKKC